MERYSRMAATLFMIALSSGALTACEFMDKFHHY